MWRFISDSAIVTDFEAGGWKLYLAATVCIVSLLLEAPAQTHYHYRHVRKAIDIITLVTYRYANDNAAASCSGR